MSDQCIGEIRMFAGVYAPAGWHYCDGSLMPVSGNEALFALIGAVWGGDGRTTFGLPDFRGRVLISQGTGPGLTNRVFATSGGSEVCGLVASEMPAHSHSFNVSNAAANTFDPVGASLGSVTTAGIVTGLYTTTSGTTVAMDENMLDFAGAPAPGAAQTHENIMPSQCIGYIIALLGVFPDRP